MNQVHARLAKDHEELHALLECLAEDVEAPECGELEATWGALEARLLRHIDAEERYLLPLLEASHPAEVARNRAEHARIRDLVAELGIAVELHSARKPAVMQLIELLTRHAQHEDEVLYRLAGAKASVAVAHSVFATLKDALGTAVRRGKSLFESAGRSRVEP